MKFGMYSRVPVRETPLRETFAKISEIKESLLLELDSNLKVFLSLKSIENSSPDKDSVKDFQAIAEKK